jgi:hypothetical protein
MKRQCTVGCRAYVRSIGIFWPSRSGSIFNVYGTGTTSVTSQIFTRDHTVHCKNKHNALEIFYI